MIERHGDITKADGTEAAVIVMEHLRHRIEKCKEAKKDEWRQMEVDALTTAIIELSKPLSDEGKREIACCCQSAEIRKTILALCGRT